MSRATRSIKVISIILLFFGILAAFTVGIPTPKPWATINYPLTFMGCLGYLFLVIGLFNAVVLFSLNLTSAAISALFTSLILNLIVGYFAANAIAPESAVLGLVFGSTVFIVISNNNETLVRLKLSYSNKRLSQSKLK